LRVFDSSLLVDNLARGGDDDDDDGFSFGGMGFEAADGVIHALDLLVGGVDLLREGGKDLDVGIGNVCQALVGGF
jgi:hypothetical protein